MDILKAIYKGEYRTEHFLTEEYEAAQRKNTELVETLLSSLAPEDLERGSCVLLELLRRIDKIN